MLDTGRQGDVRHGRDCPEAARSGRLRSPSAALGRRALLRLASRNRHLWKDPEATLASAQAFLYAFSVMILVRQLARPL